MKKFQFIVLMFKLLLLAGIFTAIVGCSENLVRVKPWERGDLSGKIMDPDLNPLEEFDRNHIYFSKEGSMGGFRSGGGGCGCN